jgi:hypothetical protein
LGCSRPELQLGRFRTPGLQTWLGAFGVALLVLAITLRAHPAPYSYIDIRVQPGVLDVTVTAHAYDLAHDLENAPQEQLLDPVFAGSRAKSIYSLLEKRLTLEANGAPLEHGTWTGPQIAVEQQLLRIHTQYALASVPASITITAKMFPYDPAHQTFINIYEGDVLNSQQILDFRRTNVEYVMHTRLGLLWTVRRSLGDGIARALGGRELVLCMVGLLLLGGPPQRVAGIFGAFAAASFVTFSLSAWNVVSLPARVVAPAMALSVVYVGVDNLMIRGGRDMRIWTAAAFGLVHGFGLADLWRSIDRPTAWDVWGLYAFNTGAAIGLLVIVAAVLSALSMARTRNERTRRLFVVAGSSAVAAAGTFWFIERLILR